MSVRLRRQSILAHGCNRDPERMCNLLVGDPLSQAVDGFSKIHVCSMLDSLYAVSYTIASRDAQYKTGESASLGREWPIHPPPRNDPKAARSPKLPCWTARVKRIGVYDA